MESTKKCTRCGEVKPLSAFSKHRLSSDGHAWQCKECNTNRGKEWRKTPSGIYTTLRSGQRFYNKKPVTISRQDFIEWYDGQPKTCTYCRIKEEYLPLVGGSYLGYTDRLTVDCKINDVGYTSENIVLACHRCNFVKSNIFYYEEMIEIGQKYIRPKWEKLLKANKSE